MLFRSGAHAAADAGGQPDPGGHGGLRAAPRDGDADDAGTADPGDAVGGQLELECHWGVGEQRKRGAAAGLRRAAANAAAS